MSNNERSGPRIEYEDGPGHNGTFYFAFYSGEGSMPTETGQKSFGALATYHHRTERREGCHVELVGVPGLANTLIKEEETRRIAEFNQKQAREQTST